MLLKLKFLKYSLPILLIIFLIIIIKIQNHKSCTITPPISNSPNINGSTVNFSWKSGLNNQITYLNVSTSSALKSDDTLEDPDIVNDVVTDQESYSKSNLKPGTYYWNIVADGCGQRKPSQINNFTIPATINDTCNPTPAILGEPIIEGSKVTLNWINSQSAETIYINISTSNKMNSDGTLKNLDISNDVVSGKISFIRENLSPGNYYWNIVSDGCGERKISELSSFSIK